MAEYELNLRDYYRIFRKRKVTIFIIFCMVIGISYYFISSQKPVYQSNLKVKFIQRVPVIGEGYAYALGNLIQSQLEIIKSFPVAEKAAEALGRLGGVTDLLEREDIVHGIQRKVSALQIGDTNVIRITVTGPNAEETKPIADAVAKAYVAYNLEETGREKRAVRVFIEEELKKAEERLFKSEEALRQFKEGSPLADQVADIRSSVMALELKREDLLARATEKHPEVERLNQQIASAGEKLKQLPEEELTSSRLTKERRDNQDLVSQLKQKYNESRIEESGNVGNVRILEHASPPSISLQTDQKVSMVLAICSGLLLGFIAAFFKEALDTSIGVVEDIESFLGVGVLGMIPHMVDTAEKKRFSLFPRIGGEEKKLTETRYRLVTQFDPRSPEAESYHTLRTSIYSVLPQKQQLAIALSSTGPREGKTLTCANLAVASAQMGKKTLLIDVDFRRPMIHEIFGLERTPGLFEVLTKTVSYEQALKNVSDLLVADVKWQEALKSPHLGYLNFMTSGHLPPNPPELLASHEMEELIRTLRTQFDFLIFDCPPVLPVTDTLILAPKLDGIVLVYQSGRTARNALKRAKTQLDTAQAKLLGVVFNDIRAIEVEPSSSYYYRYRKYYPEGEKAEKGT